MRKAKDGKPFDIVDEDVDTPIDVVEVINLARPQGVQRRRMFVKLDTNAVHIPIPALGPSLGVAPSGTCT